MSSELLKVWRAGRVMRWHTNPHLGDTVDPDDGHAARVTLLALKLKPDLSREAIIAALTHDLGESGTGDFSYDVKIANPKLAEDIGVLEQRRRAELGFPDQTILTEERQLIRLCDWLDAWLWMMHNKPHLRSRADWRDQAKASLTAALAISPEVQSAVLKVLAEMYREFDQ